jgi:peptidyl-tRNA hydrolase
MQNPFTGKTEKLTQDDIAVLSLLKEVRSGNVKAIQEWLDNRFGKITDKVEHSGQIEIDLYENLSKDELKKELDKLGLSDKLFDK